MSFDEEEIPALDEAELLRKQARAFAPAQMLACEACLRANPPTRMNCLYCGAALPVNEAEADLRRPTLRPLEHWERGFNVVLRPTQAEQNAAPNLDDSALAEAASWLRMETGLLRQIAEARELLPLARASSLDEAELILRRLDAMNWRASIVTDEALAIDSRPPRRIHQLELTNEGLAAWDNVSGERDSVAWPEIALLVGGRMFWKRIEVEEKRKRGLKSEIVDAREFQEDEGVLDIYAATLPSNWRVMAEGFDYSCLGAQKGLLTAQNFTRLIETLRERAASAVYADAYRRVRHLLKTAWPLVERTESRGLRRARPGRLHTEVVTSVTNESQFTRYSRLLYHFVAQQQQPHE